MWESLATCVLSSGKRAVASMRAIVASEEINPCLCRYSLDVSARWRNALQRWRIKGRALAESTHIDRVFLGLVKHVLQSQNARYRQAIHIVTFCALRSGPTAAPRRHPSALGMDGQACRTSNALLKASSAQRSWTEVVASLGERRRDQRVIDTRPTVNSSA